MGRGVVTLATSTGGLCEGGEGRMSCRGEASEAMEEGDGRRGIQVYNERVAGHPGLVSNIIPVGGWLAVSLVLVEDVSG